MSGNLTHPPAKIILQYLLDQALATQFDADSAWPVYLNYMPDGSDVVQNCLAVYDTSGVIDGRLQYDGVFQEGHGVQIKIRAIDDNTCRNKANTIRNNFDTVVLRKIVTVDGTDYLLQAINRTSDILRLGPRKETNSREYTLNLIASIALN